MWFWLQSETGYNKTKRKRTESSRLKILTPKQMLQRLPIALAQIKVGNDSEILLNSIRQFVYSLYQSKEITNRSTIAKSNQYNYKNGYYVYELKKAQNRMF